MEAEEQKNFPWRFWRQVVTVFVALLLCCLAIVSVHNRPSHYSLDEHIERVTERAKKRYIEKGEYTGLTVYPLYSENDEAIYFSIEFEPYGFQYVMISPYAGRGFSINSFMYWCQHSPGFDWQRYVIEEGHEDCYWHEYTKEWVPISGRRYERIDGEPVIYNESHYKVAGITDERRYLLRCYDCYVPAVKRGDKYLNLVSMQEMEYNPQATEETMPAWHNTFFFKKGL